MAPVYGENKNINNDVSISVIDPTDDLPNDYTTLVTRAEGERIRQIWVSKLEALPDGGTLVLDFSSVFAIDHSFVAEVLAPILRETANGEHGNRWIVGINFDQRRSPTILNTDLISMGVNLLVFDKTENPLWLGIADEATQRVVNMVYANNKETPEHLQLLLSLDRKRISSIIEELVKSRHIVVETTPDDGLKVIKPSIDSNTIRTKGMNNILHEFRSRIRDAIEKGCHFELSPDIHATEYLHLIQVFTDARLTAKVAYIVAERFRKDNPDIVLTITTPAAMAFSLCVADYHGASFICADINDTGDAILHPGMSIIRDSKVLLAIDVIATGWDISALLKLVLKEHASIVGICAAVDVSGGKVRFPEYKYERIESLQLGQYYVSSCPACREKLLLRSSIPVSRGMVR